MAEVKERRHIMHDHKLVDVLRIEILE